MQTADCLVVWWGRKRALLLAAMRAKSWAALMVHHWAAPSASSWVCYWADLLGNKLAVSMADRLVDKKASCWVVLMAVLTDESLVELLV